VKLCVGPEFLTREEVPLMVLHAGGREIPLTAEEELDAYAAEITEVIVGYIIIDTLDVLRRTPNVVDLWVKMPVKDFGALAGLPRLKSLRLDRNTANLSFLENLPGLERLHLDRWTKGADRLASLTNLRSLGVRQFPHPDLGLLSQMERLSQLWMAGPRIESLQGLPPSVRLLEVSEARRLRSIAAVARCHQMTDCRVMTARALETLHGLEGLPVKTLVFQKLGRLASLEPLRNLTALDFLTLTTDLAPGIDFSPIYSLPALRKLFLLDTCGVDEARLKQMRNLDYKLCWPD
jgi:hypothetical protein